MGNIFSKPYVVNTRNRILSKHVQMSMDTRYTNLNNNILVIGGSGTGKTYRFVKPLIMQQSSSFIITDPKGEVSRDTLPFLKQSGYEVKVLNLLNEDEMMKSSHFNPFLYIQSEVDVIKLITNLISNTTPKGSTTQDPFWEKAESMLLQALFYYVWLEGVPAGISECKTVLGEDDRAAILDLIHDPKVEKVHNVRAVMELLKFAEFKEDPRTGAKMDSTLDVIMRELEKQHPNHKAVLNYNKVMRGAADTVRSIIISANARLAPVQSEAVLQILDDDEIDIPLIGTRKTAVYCVIPDNDKTYNFLIGILYSMMFQQLYYEADFVHNGSLPVHVTFLLDEFANVALPDDYLSLLSTMRSRYISSVIIIQDLSQIKTLFKDGQHEQIQANCDVTVYLGGNGPNTQKELSELMGKATIDKKTSGETLGKQGNSTRNYDVLGRELMFPDELRKMDGRKCILFIRGFDPVLDDKIESRKHPLWNQMCEAAKTGYFDARLERLREKVTSQRGKKAGFVDEVDFAHLQLIEKKQRKHYEEEKRVTDLMQAEPPEKPDTRIWQLSFEELMQLDHILGQESEPVPLDETLLERARQALEEAVKEETQEQMEEETQGQMKGEAWQINTKKFQDPEEAICYAQLKKEAFTDEQIRLILPLAARHCMMTDDILAVFDAGMDTETISLLVEQMIC